MCVAGLAVGEYQLFVVAAAPAEVHVAGRTFHVHAAAVLLDADAALRTLAPVRRIAADPTEHAGPVAAEPVEHPAQQARVRRRVARRADRRAALAAAEVPAVGPRRGPAVDRPAVGRHAVVVAVAVRQHEGADRRIVQPIQTAGAEQVLQVPEHQRLAAAVRAAAYRNVVVPHRVLDQVFDTSAAVRVAAVLRHVQGRGLHRAEADRAVRKPVRVVVGVVPRLRGRRTTPGQFLSPCVHSAD